MSTCINPLNIGIIGMGFGRHLARAVCGLSEYRLIAVADRKLKQEELAECSLPEGVGFYTDALELLENEKLDGLILAIAPKHREPILTWCAANSLPIFVEKPWAGNPIQARRFAAICQPISESTMLGFSFRFHPAVRRLRQLLDGDLGDVWMANGEYAFDWNLGSDGWIWDPDSGGGVFNENSCHMLDVLCHLVGRPISVQAAVHNPRLMPSAELAAVTITFASGAVAGVTFAAHAAGAMDDFPRLDLVTAGGRASLSGRGHIWHSLTWALRGENEAHKFSAAPEYLGETRYSEALRQFALCIRDRVIMPATISDGILAVELASAIYASAAHGVSVSIPR